MRHWCRREDCLLRHIHTCSTVSKKALTSPRHHCRYVFWMMLTVQYACSIGVPRTSLGPTSVNCFSSQNFAVTNRNPPKHPTQLTASYSTPSISESSPPSLLPPSQQTFRTISKMFTPRSWHIRALLAFVQSPTASFFSHPRQALHYLEVQFVFEMLTAFIMAHEHIDVSTLFPDNIAYRPAFMRLQHEQKSELSRAGKTDAMRCDVRCVDPCPCSPLRVLTTRTCDSCSSVSSVRFFPFELDSVIVSRQCRTRAKGFPEILNSGNQPTNSFQSIPLYHSFTYHSYVSILVVVVDQQQQRGFW